MSSKFAVVAGVGALCSGMALGLVDAHAQSAGGTSEACFNAGILNKGSKIDYDMKVSGDGATPPRRTVVTVGGTKTFNGFQAVESTAKFFDDAGQKVAVNLSYSALSGKYLLYYGLKSNGVRQFSEPAHQTPTKLKIGNSFKQTYSTRTVYDGGREETTSSKDKYTFTGFEELKFAVGRFKACVVTIRTTSTIGGASYLTNRTDWIAAEGPYRGFTLRTKVSAGYPGGIQVNQVINVTTIRTFNMK